MAVAGEIEVAIGTERGEQLVAGGVDGCTDILHRTDAARGQFGTPDVVATQTAGHVADKVEPHAVGRHRGMGKGGERVLRHLEDGGLAPRGIAALRGGYLGIARIGGVGLAHRQVHGPEVGREGTGPLVLLGVEFAVYRLGLGPFALVVLLREEDVGILGAGDAADLVALGLIAGAGEEELVAVVASQHGRILGTTRVEQFLLLHGVARILGFLLPLRSHTGRLQSHQELGFECRAL